MKAMVVYSSRTGNTKKLANVIFAAIPGDSKDIQPIDEYEGKAADTFFVGFWTDRGTCDMSVVELLSELHGRNVALFGTCGMGSDAKYRNAIEQQVKVWLPEDNRYLGCFMCQGKMLIRVRKKYEAMSAQGPDAERRQLLLDNFDKALLHPDEEDLKNAFDFAVRMMASVERAEC